MLCHLSHAACRARRHCRAGLRALRLAAHGLYGRAQFRHSPVVAPGSVTACKGLQGNGWWFAKSGAASRFIFPSPRAPNPAFKRTPKSCAFGCRLTPRRALRNTREATAQANMNARCSLSSRRALASRRVVCSAGSVRRPGAWPGSPPSVALGLPSSVAVRSSSRFAQPVVGADSPGGQCWLAGPGSVPPGLPLNSNVGR